MYSGEKEPTSLLATMMIRLLLVVRMAALASEKAFDWASKSKESICLTTWKMISKYDLLLLGQLPVTRFTPIEKEPISVHGPGEMGRVHLHCFARVAYSRLGAGG